MNRMPLTTADADLQATESTEDVVEQDLLVEEVSIDGMCGVY
jgi:mycofactocin precursor